MMRLNSIRIRNFHRLMANKIDFFRYVPKILDTSMLDEVKD